MNKLSFKVYLLNEELNKFTEVRRFCLDIGIAKNFVALREKLQSIFPELHEKKFTVTWKGEYVIPFIYSLFTSRLERIVSIQRELSGICASIL